MKTKLTRLIERLIELCDRAQDDEVTDELDNALIHLETASDRLVQMDEEEDYDDDEPDIDEFSVPIPGDPDYDYPL